MKLEQNTGRDPERSWSRENGHLTYQHTFDALQNSQTMKTNTSKIKIA